jgi:acyl-CoA hydrolase
METYTLVRPEHLNHHGNLFGGCMLKWVDEFAWLTASREYVGARLVTVAMDEVVFKKSVRCGAILRFVIERLRAGRTSVTYEVTVCADEPGSRIERSVFATRVTFVNVDAKGRKRVLPLSYQRIRSAAKNRKTG